MAIIIYAFLVTILAIVFYAQSEKHKAANDSYYRRYDWEHDLRRKTESELRMFKEEHKNLKDVMTEAKFALMLVPYQRKIELMGRDIERLIENQCDGLEACGLVSEEDMCPDLMAQCKRCSTTEKE